MGGPPVGEAWDFGDVGAVGQERYLHVVEPMITTRSGAGIRAGLELNREVRRGLSGSLSVALHPGRELWDVITCADAGIQLLQAQYQWWSRATAHGSGIYYFNDCTPSCAGGTFHSQRAVFTLYRVVRTARYGPLFSRISIDTRRAHHVYLLQTSTG